MQTKQASKSRGRKRERSVHTSLPSLSLFFTSPSSRPRLRGRPRRPRTCARTWRACRPPRPPRRRPPSIGGARSGPGVVLVFGFWFRGGGGGERRREEEETEKKKGRSFFFGDRKEKKKKKKKKKKLFSSPSFQLTTDSITGLVAGATVSIVMDAPLRSTSVAVRTRGWMPRRGICSFFRGDFFSDRRRKWGLSSKLSSLEKKERKKTTKRCSAAAAACFPPFLHFLGARLPRVSFFLDAATADAGALVAARGLVLGPRCRR
jgi:hypothetical protein